MSKSSSTTTTVTLAHGMTIDGKYHNAGTKITVDKGAVAGLTAAGYVVDDDATALDPLAPAE